MATFDYPTALQNVFAGNKVARSDWVDRNQWLFLMKGEVFEKLTFPSGTEDATITDQIWIKTSKGTMGPYGGCNCDTTADDWIVF